MDPPGSLCAYIPSSVTLNAAAVLPRLEISLPVPFLARPPRTGFASSGRGVLAAYEVGQDLRTLQPPVFISRIRIPCLGLHVLGMLLFLFEEVSSHSRVTQCGARPSMIIQHCHLSLAMRTQQLRANSMLVKQLGTAVTCRGILRDRPDPTLQPSFQPSLPPKYATYATPWISCP